MPAPRKDPAISLILSLFIPGVGSMVNGDVGIGVLILVLYFVIGAPLICFFGLGVLVMLPVWVWGMIDAYTGAQRWNARHGIIS